MDLSEIAIAFNDCNAETSGHSFKDYVDAKKQNGLVFSRGVIVDDANNFILYDCEKLLTKAILNSISADLLSCNGLFNWSFVSSYYSSFFAVQALNRLQLNFTGYQYKCELINFNRKEINLFENPKSTGSHVEQFELFKTNAKEFKKNKGDRFWNIGLGNFEEIEGYNSEPNLRNEINYSISILHKFYYELSISKNDYNKIVRDNLRSPFVERETISLPPNFARRASKIAIARIRVLSSVMNYIANYNSEYKSYFERNMRNRIIPIKERYPFISNWLLNQLEDWLKFHELPIEEVKVKAIL